MGKDKRKSKEQIEQVGADDEQLDQADDCCVKDYTPPPKDAIVEKIY